MFETWAAWLGESMLWIERTGPLGWVAFVVLYIVSCVLFLPGSVLSLGAGAIYGFWGGTLLVSVASVGGALANFLSARYLLRRWMERKFEESRRFRALNHLATRNAWQMLLLTRISPIFPHSLVSCAFGLSRLGFWKFTLASWVGFLPISAACAYAGAIVGSAAKSGWPDSPWSWALHAGEIALTIAVSVWISRIARARLREIRAAEPV